MDWTGSRSREGHSAPNTWGGVFLFQHPWSLLKPAYVPPPPPGLPGEHGGLVDDSLGLWAGLAQGLEDGHSGPQTWGGVFLLQLPWSTLRSAPVPLPSPDSLGSKEGQLMTAY